MIDLPLDRNGIPVLAWRKARPKVDRHAVYAKGKGRCHYCGCPLRLFGAWRKNHMTVDHLRPIAYGGTDHISNLVPACRECNGAKADTPEYGMFGKRIFEDKKEIL